jgi:hypothetical protein
MSVHLDTGYDSAKTRDLLTELGCDAVVSAKVFPLQAGRRRLRPAVSGSRAIRAGAPILSARDSCSSANVLPWASSRRLEEAHR